MLKCKRALCRPEVSHGSVASSLGNTIREIRTSSNWRASVCLPFFFNYSWFIVVLFILRLNYKPKLHHRISAPRNLLPPDLMAFCPWASAATLGPRDAEHSTSWTGKPRGLGAGVREAPKISLALPQARGRGVWREASLILPTERGRRPGGLSLSCGLSPSYPVPHSPTLPFKCPH